MNEITSFLLLIDIMIIVSLLAIKMFYLLICFVLAMVNSDAVYDPIAKQVILKLAKKDKTWKTVAKILNLESKGE